MTLVKPCRVGDILCAGGGQRLGSYRSCMLESRCYLEKWLMLPQASPPFSLPGGGRGGRRILSLAMDEAYPYAFRNHRRCLAWDEASCKLWGPSVNLSKALLPTSCLSILQTKVTGCLLNCLACQHLSMCWSLCLTKSPIWLTPCLPLRPVLCP